MPSVDGPDLVWPNIGLSQSRSVIAARIVGNNMAAAVKTDRHARRIGNLPGCVYVYVYVCDYD